MVNANIAIITELQTFLSTLSMDSSIRSLFTNNKGDFSGNRKLPLSRLVALILNMPKRSLSIEVNEFFSTLGLEYEESCGKSAFCLQRTKLNPLFFSVWNDWLVSLFYQHYGEDVKRWRGFKLQAVDGSTAYLVNKPEVIDYFGTAGNGECKVPMARVMQVYDILNEVTVWGNMYPVKVSERSIMHYRIQCFAEDSLSIFDRGFPSFALMYLMENQERPRYFVMRCRGDFNKETLAFLQGNENDCTVELKAGYKAIRTLRDQGYLTTAETSLKVRMVKVELSTGEIEILLTNLYNQLNYSVLDLKELYRLRWAIETSYNHQKNQQQMEQFSGHRSICILQDYLAGLFVSNLQCLIEKQCEPYLQEKNKTRKYPQKINKNVSWAALKHNIVKLFLFSNPEKILLVLQKEFERNIEPKRPGRHNPRIKKSRRLTGKYYTVTNYRRAI